MKSSVNIKGTKSGMIIVLDKELPFEEIKEINFRRLQVFLERPRLQLHLKEGNCLILRNMKLQILYRNVQI